MKRFGLAGGKGSCRGSGRQVRKLISKDQVDTVLGRGRELCLCHRAE